MKKVFFITLMFLISSISFAEVMHPTLSDQLNAKASLLSDAASIISKAESSDDLKNISHYYVTEIQYSFDPMGIIFNYVSPFQGEEDKCLTVNNQTAAIQIYPSCPSSIEY